MEDCVLHTLSLTVDSLSRPNCDVSVCLSVCLSVTDLQRACDEKDARAIRRQVDKIRESRLTKYLQNETREAMCLVKQG